MEEEESPVKDDHMVQIPNYVSPLKNTVILSTSFLLCYTAFQAIQNLQSSLNQNADLGMASLACVYSGIIFSGILSPVIINQIGVKLALILGWASHCLYTAANFYPAWWSLVPASVILGLAVGPMWTSQGIYITTMADIYSRVKSVGSHESMSKLFGIFGLIFQSAQITGNLIASLVLFRDVHDNFPANETRICGSDDCPGIPSSTTKIPHPADYTVNSLMGVFFTCDFLGLLLTMFFLAPITTVNLEDTTPVAKLKTMFSSLKDVALILLIPFFFAKSMSVSIVLTSFPKAFVSCTAGIKMVGFVMACYGGCTAGLSLLSGVLAKYSNRYVMLGSSYLIELIALLTLLLWKPDPDKIYILFLFTVVSALADSLWLTQSGTLVGMLFSHKRDSAFAIFNTFGAAAFAVTLAYDRFACLSTKLYVNLALWVVGSVCYCTVELRNRYDRRQPEGYEEIQ